VRVERVNKQGNDENSKVKEESEYKRQMNLNREYNKLIEERKRKELAK
jgi:hypothetical protein